MEACGINDDTDKLLDDDASPPPRGIPLIIFDRSRSRDEDDDDEKNDGRGNAVAFTLVVASNNSRKDTDLI
jgi:hypothetical protein